MNQSVRKMFLIGLSQIEQAAHHDINAPAGLLFYQDDDVAVLRHSYLCQTTNTLLYYHKNGRITIQLPYICGMQAALRRQFSLTEMLHFPQVSDSAPNVPW